MINLLIIQACQSGSVGQDGQLVQVVQVVQVRQQCRLTICIELDELTNSEAAAATPPTVIQNL